MDKNISQLLINRNISNYRIISGHDPNAIVFDIGNRILKITKMNQFYAEMHMGALYDIHNALTPIHVTPKLMSVDYINGYVVTEFEKVKNTGEVISSNEAGRALGKAHCALKDVKVRKSYPWDGFYGEKQEFSCVIPMVKNEFIRETAYELLDYIKNRMLNNAKIQYVHRDLNPGNIIKSKEYVYLIDWDMAYGGYIVDDIAMSICCLGAVAIEQGESLTRHCKDFLIGYMSENQVKWDDKDSSELVSAIALAGLRQGVSGWFSDKGNLSATYWKHILKRMEISLLLCKSFEG